MFANDTHLDLSRAALLRRWLRRLVVRRAISESSAVAFCAPTDDIGVEILASGSFESEYLEFLKLLLDRLKLEGDLIALDVGANIGTHSIFFSKMFDRVMSFEPNPAVFLVCKANRIWSGQDNIEIFDIALSNTNGNATLYIPQSGQFGWASLDNAKGRKAAMVRMERGDDFILPRLHANERVALIKIDVERHEAQVIEGLSGLIRRHKPLIIFESLGSENFLRSRAVLDDCGYEAYYSITRTWDRARPFAKCLAIIGGIKVYLTPCMDEEAQRQTAIIAVPPMTKLPQRGEQELQCISKVHGQVAGHGASFL